MYSGTPNLKQTMVQYYDSRYAYSLRRQLHISIAPKFYNFCQPKKQVIEDFLFHSHAQSNFNFTSFPNKWKYNAVAMTESKLVL